MRTEQRVRRNRSVVADRTGGRWTLRRGRWLHGCRATSRHGRRTNSCALKRLPDDDARARDLLLEYEMRLGRLPIEAVPDQHSARLDLRWRRRVAIDGAWHRRPLELDVTVVTLEANGDERDPVLGHVGHDPVAQRRGRGRCLGRLCLIRYIQAVGEWGTSLPGASSKYGIVGFCWGGSTVFALAVAAPQSLGAVVVYYGGSPAAEALATVQAPILGLYGEDDARVNSTVPPAEAALRSAGKTFEAHTLAGAGHGFTRGQEDREGANAEAVKQAWPLTVAWFKRHLGSEGPQR